jgi:hypothetical protein
MNRYLQGVPRQQLLVVKSITLAKLAAKPKRTQEVVNILSKFFLGFAPAERPIESDMAGQRPYAKIDAGRERKCLRLDG